MRAPSRSRQPGPPAALACGEYERSTEHLHIYDPHVPNVDATRLLVREFGRPLGYVTLTGEVRSADLAGGTDGFARVVADADPVTADRLPSVTVVVCTRNRASSLRACLESLVAVDYPEVEFLVVDNAPSDDSARQAVRTVQAADRRFRYVVEPVPGLSRARNRGLRSSSADIVAFTDDDVRVSPDWVSGLVSGFRSGPDVACVTGLVASQRVVNDYERYFERRYSSWWTRMDPATYSYARSSGDPLFPYSAGRFGTGANFAVDRKLVLASGGFDVALGAGTRAQGGEDLDMFARVLLAGHELRYQPGAVVWHSHRADRRGTLRQAFQYGCGCAAYVTKLVSAPNTRREVLRRAPRGARHILGAMSAAQHSGSNDTLAAAAVAAELAGYLAGPAAYLVGRRRPAASPARRRFAKQASSERSEDGS